MKRKNIGYYISKRKCLKVYAKKKLNKRTKKVKLIKVNSRGKTLRKGTKIYKNKNDCKRKLSNMKLLEKKKKEKLHKKKVIKYKKHSNFGQECSYAVPYFGQMAPSISKITSGTPLTGHSSIAWKWPTPPSALKLDKQSGGWLKY